jgi:exodeoxyribonuclease VIII
MAAKDLRVVEHMPDAEYHAVQAIGGSSLHLAEQSMAHLKEQMDNPRPATKQMAFGSAVHLLLQGIGAYQARYVVKPAELNGKGKGGRTKVVEWEADVAVSGMEPIDQADNDAAFAALANLQEHPVARDLLRGAQHELSMFWTDPATGVACKSRDDIYRGDLGPAIIDLKTCRDASPREFQRSIANFGYHLQAAHYSAAVDATLWVWLCVENTAPHNVAVYTASPTMLAIGSQRRDAILKRIAECQAKGVWPGYSTEPQQLDLPRWAASAEGDDSNG